MFLILKKNNLDPAISAVREKGQLVAFFFPIKNYSKMGIDKKIGQAPTREPFSTQQKRHFVRSAFLNGGAAIFDGVRVLRTPSGNAQFPV